MVGGGGGTPLFGLYRDVLLDRVWFFWLSVLNRVYNFYVSLKLRQVFRNPRSEMFAGL